MKVSFKAETRRGVYREVFRRGDWLVKRYHYQGLRFDKPWRKEYAALSRLPEGVGQDLLTRAFSKRMVVVHRRRFIQGTPVSRVEPQELATCLHRTHQSGVIGLDPHPANFIRDPEGLLRLIDFGRAVCARPGSLRGSLAIGQELHRVQIDAYKEPEGFHAFIEAFRPKVSPTAWRVAWTAYRVRHVARRLAGRGKAR